ETFRGVDKFGAPILECVHHGLVSVVDGEGTAILSIGDTRALLHLRSCAKPFQVLPIFEAGFFSDSNDPSLPKLIPADLPLFLSSHSGSFMQTDRIRQILQLISLDEQALRCGVHPPQDEQALNEIIKSNGIASPLHTNCSGKHT